MFSMIVSPHNPPGIESGHEPQIVSDALKVLLGFMFLGFRIPIEGEPNYPLTAPPSVRHCTTSRIGEVDTVFTLWHQGELYSTLALWYLYCSIHSMLYLPRAI